MDNLPDLILNIARILSVIGMILFATLLVLGCISDRQTQRLLRMKHCADRRHREHMELSRTLPAPKPENTPRYVIIEPTHLF